ncbi:MAG: hypothetical protein R3C26_25135 [Calditrichia bacterium]
MILNKIFNSLCAGVRLFAQKYAVGRDQKFHRNAARWRRADVPANRPESDPYFRRAKNCCRKSPLTPKEKEIVVGLVDKLEATK